VVLKNNIVVEAAAAAVVLAERVERTDCPEHPHPKSLNAAREE